MTTWPLFLLAAFPLWQACNNEWKTSLRDTTLWLIATWLAWLGVAIRSDLDPLAPYGRYGALALALATLVSVFGARQPTAPWNFVVLGFLAVLGLPLFEQPLDEHWRLDAPRSLFLALVLAVGIVNFLPTRLGAVSLMLGAAGGIELATLFSPGLFPRGIAWTRVVESLLATAPLVGWLTAHTSDTGCKTSILWRRFRDRYGVVWALRVKEQFNNAARHQGLRGSLDWFGLETVEPSSEDDERSLKLLDAILTRFGAPALDVHSERG
jgi:hypothetical protein